MKRIMTISMLILTLLASACVQAGTATPAPTLDVSKTVEAARTESVGTAAADFATQVLPTLVQPSATLAPTATELPTPTLVPTLVPADTLAPTLAPANTQPPVSNATAVPADYTCSVTASSPAYLAQFAPYGEMDGKWTVKNTGSKSWGSTDVDVSYVSGENMAQYEDSYNLAKDVSPGASIDIVVDMLAPATPGIYKTTWGLVRSGSAFCMLNLTIEVK